MTPRLAALLMAIVLVVGGCSSSPPEPSGANGNGVGYFHDAKHHVSCWTFGAAASNFPAAISCLPDSQVTEP